jgi:hypothetical protein
MISVRELLILNLTLQAFDGLFSYQAFSLLGAHEANPFVGAAISSWGVIAGLLYKKVFRLCSAAPDILSRFQTPITCKASVDSDGVGLYIGRGRLSVGDSAIRNHPASGNHARQNSSFR